MKFTVSLAATALALAFALPLQAQDLNLKPLPPPPSINDPGVKPTPLPTPSKDVPHPPTDLPSMHDSGPLDANGKTPLKVTVRQQGDDTVEEYREGGKIYMVKVTPKHGAPYTIMADDDGKLQRDAKLGPVAPVYYKVYEWGAAPKTVDEQNAQ
jgi:hypothetical protein